MRPAPAPRLPRPATFGYEIPLRAWIRAPRSTPDGRIQRLYPPRPTRGTGPDVEPLSLPRPTPDGRIAHLHAPPSRRGVHESMPGPDTLLLAAPPGPDGRPEPAKKPGSPGFAKGTKASPPPPIPGEVAPGAIADFSLRDLLDHLEASGLAAWPNEEVARFASPGSFPPVLPKDAFDEEIERLLDDAREVARTCGIDDVPDTFGVPYADPTLRWGYEEGYELSDPRAVPFALLSDGLPTIGVRLPT